MIYLALSAALAGTTIEGNYLKISYNDAGLWNWHATGTGLEIRNNTSDPFIDVSYPITPWVAFTVEYNDGNGTSFDLRDKTSNGRTDLPAFSVLNISQGSSLNIFQATYGNADIDITRSELWLDDGKAMLVYFVVRNTSGSTINNFRLQVALDPDQDVNPYGESTCDVVDQQCSYHEYADTLDLAESSVKDWAQSSGYYSGVTVGFGMCDESQQDVGHADFSSDADIPYIDMAGQLEDYTIHWRFQEGVFSPGEVLGQGFVLAFGEDAATTQSTYLANRTSWCNWPDFDGDGSDDGLLGGDDCDDEDPSIHPGATEIFNDGIDQDCDGSDATTTDCFEDLDGDGWGSTSTVQSLDGDCTDPGESSSSNDCNDFDAHIYPGAYDIPNDGIDQDCTGGDVTTITCNEDQDGDGFGGTGTVQSLDNDCDDPGESNVSNDCNDHVPGIYPGAPEVPNDGVDQDCNGVDLTTNGDADGDGLLDDDETNIYNTDPHNPDTDGDGLLDGQEVIQTNTDPLNPDSDGDGLSDGQEVNTTFTNPNDTDSDDDGLTDGQEVNNTNTDPLDHDSDNDDLLDGEEVNNTNTDPNNDDTDGDGLEDGEELNDTNTNPNNPDTDGDGLTDGQEDGDYNTNPNNPDTDGDGLQDGREVNNTNTDPLDPDSDDDDLQDGFEVDTSGTDPNNRDTDGDKLPDGQEVNDTNTDPLDMDSDDDGLDDGREVEFIGTDPNNPDTDGDGMEDGTEVNVGADPFDTDTDDDTILDGPDGLGDEDHDGVINVLDPLDEVMPPPEEPNTIPTGGFTCSTTGSAGWAWLLAPLALFARRQSI